MLITLRGQRVNIFTTASLSSVSYCDNYSHIQLFITSILKSLVVPVI